MKTFDTRLEEAQHRTESMKGSTTRYRAIHHLANQVVTAVSSNLFGKDVREKYPRRIFSTEFIKSEERRRGKLSYFDFNTLGHRGWPLVEVIDAHPDQRVAPFIIKGLLLSNYSDLFAYDAPLAADYPKRNDVDAFGRTQDNVYDGYDLQGNVYPLKLHRFKDVESIDCERTIRGISGPLELEDLLAGLMVRYSVNPAML